MVFNLTVKQDHALLSKKNFSLKIERKDLFGAGFRKYDLILGSDEKDWAELTNSQNEKNQFLVMAKESLNDKKTYLIGLIYGQGGRMLVSLMHGQDKYNLRVIFPNDEH